MRLLALLFAFISVQIINAQIPNGGFENWQPYSNGQVPTGWTTSDSLSQVYLGGSSAYSGTDPHDGLLSLHLKSTQITILGLISLPVPGIATNGDLVGNFTNFTTAKLTVSGGIQDNVRSRKLQGYYKYAPAGNDSAHITALKWKYNTSTQSRDTIAFGELVLPGAVSSYQLFELSLAYRDFANQPDSSLIILTSGYLPSTVVLTNPSVTPQTELIVDELSFTGVVGIDEVPAQLNAFDLFPSPAASWMEISIDPKDASMRFGCRVLDITGKELLRRDLISMRERLDVAALPAGTYFLCLTDSDGRNIAQKRFSVAR